MKQFNMIKYAQEKNSRIVMIKKFSKFITKICGKENVNQLGFREAFGLGAMAVGLLAVINEKINKVEQDAKN